MKRTTVVLAGAILNAMLSAPVLAAEEKACVQNNRVWGWEAKDVSGKLVTV